LHARLKGQKVRDTEEPVLGRAAQLKDIDAEIRKSQGRERET
jgi:hypothetical protein